MRGRKETGKEGERPRVKISLFPFLRCYLQSVQTMFEDLKLHVPRCHTEKRDSLGLSQLAGKLCLPVEVSDP